MSDEPITRQLDALRLWPRDKGRFLHFGMRGSSFVFVAGRPVRQRVWERLLDRDDLEVRTDGYDRWLWITKQGVSRVDE